MTRRILQTNSYFDGTELHANGPYQILIEDGVIQGILDGNPDVLPPDFKNADIPVEQAGFVMPGLVEAHCHLFLDGGELDLKKRSNYMKVSKAEMAVVARQNVQTNLATGITLIRDAGDRWGVNHQMRQEMAESDDLVPEIRSPGIGIRKPKRYGGFMGREVETSDEIVTAINDILETGDELKVLLTGIIDFETGTVKGAPQFDVEETKLIVETAHELGRRTFAHCSGLAGLEVAAEAGLDSVEHGFFMTRDVLEVLAEKQIAWVPTFSPVYCQWAEPDNIGWDETSVGHLREILDGHFEHVKMAVDMGVPVVVGSDSGSYGVPHGQAVIDEIKFFLEAGISLEKALNAATSLPRRLWAETEVDIKPGNPVELIGLAATPFENNAAPWQPSWVMMGDEFQTL
ncbi:MAG: amidohydrolase family protein [Rhodospirillaceae bacterium]|jgi:imidazolonepropionase-like amidohydrolase|nr:amidohydrolase family protein [Rhodospirillaceae bacterium]MBT4589875.1 amidohydrolase family protein [Rhodospirillaceae bacterium]MBT4939597.1 amidohydrolase family protein [Rhodospirillaceae bacterium]MBT5941658.1 amidohydrolase family protein [Rhodospirillaceae bacterium]MBT7267358.1 amidohydrolase family protein [Rhodospirillaceae bacterium]